MKYAYEDMSDRQFEKLIIFLCHRLLGISVQAFATGPDGGRDAKFVGTAELHPSCAQPWAGTVIIQAKHTNGYNKHFSESDFYSRKGIGNILALELPRIKRLRTKRQLDHYMLFANRRLSGNIESEIRTHISVEAGISEPSICLCGVEQLEMWLKTFPEVARLAGIDPIDSPLIVSPDELAEVIEALARHRNTVRVAFDKPVPRVLYESKNSLNAMSPTYARQQRLNYLKDTQQIQDFLSDPQNLEFQTKYGTVTEEFQLQIISKRQDYQTFDEVLEYIVRLLFDRDAVLRKNKRLTRAMIFYMYWICDIGKINATDNATTN
jgi:hypothetical protein